MPIEVICDCGRKSSVDDRHAGKRARCPACSAVVVVPSVFHVTVPAQSDLDELPEDAVAPQAGVKPNPQPAPITAGSLPIPPAIPNEMLYDWDGKLVGEIDPSIRRVVLIRVEIPFWSMAWIILKWTLASIPTAILLAFFVAFVRSLIAGDPGGE